MALKGEDTVISFIKFLELKVTIYEGYSEINKTPNILEKINKLNRCIKLLNEVF